MESQHANHNRIRVRSKHRVNQKVAMLHGVNALLVRNNVKCCITGCGHSWSRAIPDT